MSDLILCEPCLGVITRRGGLILARAAVHPRERRRS
jgi:hypothetical protein